MTREEFNQRYLELTHAIQTGVGLDHGSGSNDGSPKHLRTGLNLAKCENAALAYLLVEKGVITEAEIFDAIIAKLEEEKSAYQEMLKQRYGGQSEITLA